MPDKTSDSPEEQKRKIRRRLLKLGVYSIPIITTIVALTDEALAVPKCPPKGAAGAKS